jgi:tetratricopeptide (TPR) repeat protein
MLFAVSNKNNFYIMKTITKIISILFLVSVSITAFSQRKISGTIYIDGKPAAGILVEPHRSSDSYYTSFDGFYEVEVSDKTKHIRFTFLDDSQRINMDEIESDVFNFSFDGSEIPDGDEEPGAIMKSLEELQRERDMDFLNSYSLYREFFRQGDYSSALPHWRKVYKTYPKSTTNIYNDGLKMMESKMDEALDGMTKVAYIDTMMIIYDKRIKNMGSKGDLMGRKAALFLEKTLTLNLSDSEFREQIKRGYGLSEDAIEETEYQTEPAVIVLFMQSTRRLFSLNEFTQATVLENFEKAMDILTKQLEDEDFYEKANQAIPLIEQIIEGSGALDCPAMVNLYTPKYKENPNDIDQIKKMLSMFRRYNCENELVIELSETLYKLEPSAEAAFNMARMFITRNEYDRAFEYYKEAYSSKDATDIQKALYYYEAAGLALQEKELKKSRDFLKEAIKLRDDYCEAYMLLAEVYALASRDFSDDDFERSTVYWLAVDYFAKAASYENCKTDAMNRVNTYKNYFPVRDEIFFRGLTEGANHFIGGWINETTKVRAKAQ